MKKMRNRPLWVAVLLLCSVLVIAADCLGIKKIAEDELESYTEAEVLCVSKFDSCWPDPLILTEYPEDDPDEDAKIFAALKAKCHVVHDCKVVGYAPELVAGWKPEYRNEQGLYLTASGMWAALGCTVATDPTVIPTGATVIIGNDVYVAADRGVTGKVVDVMVSVEEALVYGCRTEDVYWCLEGDAEE